MRYANIVRYDGGSDRIACYTIRDFPFFQIPDNTRHARNKKVEYLKTFMTFDIETTTIQETPESRPEGFMYHWQACIGGVVVYGRTWQEWLDLMGEISAWLNLSEDRRMVCYCHNYAYEFQFMRDFLKEYMGGFKVFATAARAPIYASCEAGFEFRCSYRLTNMTLAKACDNELGVIHPKASGDLDYKIRRTIESNLSDTEFGYCISDVVCLYELIENRLKNEKDSIDSIPLTSTGYIRRETRNETRKEKRYRDKIFKKQRTCPKVYTLEKEAGRGGNTHANRFLSGRIFSDCDGADVISSYPTMIMLKDMPMTCFAYYGEIESEKELDEVLANYACLFRIILTNVHIKNNVAIPYIPSAKLTAHGKGMRYDNGRVLDAPDFLSMTVVDIDWEIIKKQYDYDDIYISDMYVAKYGSLPDPIKRVTMRYFKKKCELKEKINELKALEKAGKPFDEEALANYKYLYNKVKNRLNSIFGMCYTDPVRLENFINEAGEWDVKSPTIEEALTKYNNSRNSFLVYAWGLWITARARAHLQALLDITGDNTIYCDTDSSKFITSPEIIKAIEAENEKIKAECEEKGAYCDINGKRYYMGLYEIETAGNPYKSFITLGAKKYAYIDNDGFHITVSGVNKKEGAKEMGDIKKFKPGFIFHKAGGKTLYYNDTGIHYITVDGVKMLTASNIGMIDSTYELGVTDEYAELIGFNIYKILD